MVPLCHSSTHRNSPSRSRASAEAAIAVVYYKSPNPPWKHHRRQGSGAGESLVKTIPNATDLLCLMRRRPEASDFDLIVVWRLVGMTPGHFSLGSRGGPLPPMGRGSYGAQRAPDLLPLTKLRCFLPRESRGPLPPPREEEARGRMRP